MPNYNAIEPFMKEYWAHKKKFDAGKISEEEMQRREEELRAKYRNYGKRGRK